MSAALDAPSSGGTISTLRRGVQLTPEFLAGMPVTLVLATVATLGQVLVPVAVGMLVRRRGPGLALRLQQPVRIEGVPDPRPLAEPTWDSYAGPHWPSR